MEKQTFQIPDGCKAVTVEQIGNQLITTFETMPEFKKGDFLTSDEAVVIFKAQENETDFESFVNNIGFGNSNWILKNFRLCTHKEKQYMIDYLHSKGQHFDEEKMELVEWKWKPKIGEGYFVAAAQREPFFFSNLWNNHGYENLLFERGLIHKTKEEAINHAKRMLEVK